MSKTIILREGRERSILNRHRWIFSGSIAQWPEDLVDGDICQIKDFAGNWLAMGYFRRNGSLVGRILSFDTQDPEEAVSKNLNAAWQLRKWLYPDFQENSAYRLVHGEADGLPGLVIDIYNAIAVMQITTIGMNKLRPLIVKFLKEEMNVEGIYEHSQGPSLKQEGLEDTNGWVEKAEAKQVISENGLKLMVNIEEGQKTGFFLDQREMRQRVREISKERQVLNMFSFSGGFTVAALAGGAKSAVSVDSDAEAVKLVEENIALNNLSKSEAITADAFTFLRESDWKADFVILDPPAFAKRKDEVKGAMRGYREINTTVMKKLPPQSLLLTCSCSYFVDESLFEKIIFQSALSAGRNVRILEKHRQAPDHPQSVYHPETNYLKSLLLWVE